MKTGIRRSLLKKKTKPIISSSAGTMRRWSQSIGGDRNLRNRIINSAEAVHNMDSSSSSYVNIEKVMEYLLSQYPEYCRKRLDVLTKIVSHILIDSNNNRHDDGSLSSSSSSDTTTTTNSNTTTSLDDDGNDLIKSMLRDNLIQRRNQHDQPLLLKKRKQQQQQQQEKEEHELELIDDTNNTNKLKFMVSGSSSSSKFLPSNMITGTISSCSSRKKMNNNNNNNNNNNTTTTEEEEEDDSKSVMVGPMFKDLAGMSKVIEELDMNVIYSLYHSRERLQIDARVPPKLNSGILLHGPPGCGKTVLARAIANELGVPFYIISAPQLVSGIVGSSEENIRDLFSKAHRTAPSIIFIDEIDAIAPIRGDHNNHKGTENRIVTQLMTCMDDSHNPIHNHENDQHSSSSNNNNYVLVIGATNRPEAIDPALRRPGRFDREILLPAPDESARLQILSLLTSKMRFDPTDSCAFNPLKLARLTAGYVGADLVQLVNEATTLALKRVAYKKKFQLLSEKGITDKGCKPPDWRKEPLSDEEMKSLGVTMADFEEAVKLVQPSLKREGFSAIPNVKWDDVGGLNHIRQVFDRYIIRLIKHPEYYKGTRVKIDTGFLLYGPPGCGKTLIAKAVANAAGANFIHIKGPEIFRKYVGESESEVRKIFRRARSCSPCILFFDEVDALTSNRAKDGALVVERVVTQLLSELDGAAEQRQGVYVIGATNRPDAMDPALLRPGRFGKQLYVPLPSPEERGMILKALARGNPIDATLNLMDIGKDNACNNFSGADLENLMSEAVMVALDETLTSPLTVKGEHFKRALENISPSVSDKQIQHYKLLSESFKSA